MRTAVIAVLLVLGCSSSQPVEPSRTPPTPPPPSQEIAAPTPAPDPVEAGAVDAGPTRAKMYRTAPDAAPVVDVDPDAPADVAAIPATAIVTATGLGYRFIEPGSGRGASPGPSDRVTVSYKTWTTNGALHDESPARAPRSFQVDKVIPGWTEALGLMTVGQRAIFWIPPELAYKGKAGQPQGMLVSEIELISMIQSPVVPADVAAPPRKAKRLRKGIRYLSLVRGTGKKRPRSFDTVKVHYTGWTTDGKMFDSSITRDKPASFSLDRVIEGWTIAVGRMRVGDKWRIWIPEELAYKGRPGAPQGTLVFEVELLEVIVVSPPPKTPRNVKRAPRRAKKTIGGVRYVYLKRARGKGSKVEAGDQVRVHYSGWTTDGKMFDSSVTRGRPFDFKLSQVIPGWSEGLMVMRVGDKVRMWIPEELAYKGRPGRPQGTLVFDVELLEIVPPPPLTSPSP